MTFVPPVAIELNANDPALDDHRPGGLPLFGTTLSIEALCNAVLPARPAAEIVAIEQIDVCEPCILDNGERRHIFVAGGPVQEDARGRHIAARLFSRTAAGGETLHLCGHVRQDRDVSIPAAPHEIATMTDQVTAQDVYRLYFHGPSFRVIAAGQFRAGTVTCRLSPAAELAVLPVIARLIEFGLQSAGLLELAETGRMMIPHAIGAIRVGGAAIAGPVYAIARRCTPTTDVGGIDIKVVDGSGRVLAMIQGYQTTPLPFSVPSSAAQTLARQLQRQ